MAKTKARETKPSRFASAVKLKEQANARKEPRSVAAVDAPQNASSKGPISKEPRGKDAHREGKIMASCWLPMEARSAFRAIQVTHPELTMQAMMEEAVRDYLAKHGVGMHKRV
jgi:hypothetical protein